MIAARPNFEGGIMSAATKHQVVNPFTPVFGKVPAYMAGREQIIDDMVLAFESEGNDPNLCSIFVGARGTGKTALLTYLGYRAQQLGWIAVNVTAGEGMLDDILQRLRESAQHLVDGPSARKLTGASINGIGGLTWENAAAPQANWRSRMNELFSALEEAETGVLITVDEVDCSIDEMVSLVTTYQHFVRENKRVALLMAGLPHRVSSLLTGKSTSFLRRAAQHSLGSIPSYEVKEAFLLTVEDGGKSIEEDALEVATGAIGGFPFMFQLVGYRSWNMARQSHAITVEHVRQGAKLAQEELESRVFEATLSELSGKDVEFLCAMDAGDGELTSRKQLMERLGKGSSHISTYKKRLMDAGVIEEPRPGEFRFSLPGFGSYLAKR